jgi:hypothetical protein
MLNRLRGVKSEMTKNKLLYILMIPLLGIILYLNGKVDSTVKSSSPSVQQAPVPAVANNVNKTTENLTAADPNQFGIETEDKNGVVKTENDWASQMGKTLNEPAVAQAMAQQGLLEELKNNPERIKEKLDRVEEEIKLQEVRVRQHPTDSDEKDRLQSLYMLKATLTSLNEKVSAGPSNP